MALGDLLRRRGKVDKAIKVHQALLARPAMKQVLSDEIKLQLALDHVAAGLLDRAERLLNEILSESKSKSKSQALQQLITVYQTEKDWENAINSSKQLLSDPAFKKDLDLRGDAAHFCCELAEKSLELNQDAKAKSQLKRAFGFDRKSNRALFLQARIEQRAGDFKAAIKQLIRINESSPEFVSLLIEPLSECHRQLGSMQEFEKLLRKLLAQNSDINLVLALSELIKKDAGNEAAVVFLNENISSNPSLEGLLELLGLQLSGVDNDFGKSVIAAQQLIHNILHRSFEYQCNNCGFESKSHYWMCPSCKKWDKIKSIHGAAIS